MVLQMGYDLLTTGRTFAQGSQPTSGVDVVVSAGGNMYTQRI
jgi:hypothetical protein